MHEYRDERRCYFHPREMIVGVCALCLNERLLVVAANQETNTNIYMNLTPKRVLPKIFALTNLLNKHSKSEVYDSTSSAHSQEDSFISIKFEENGVASWDKGKISKISHDEQCKMSSDEISLDKTMKIKSVIEHTKPRAKLRWRRGIGRLFHLNKWKKSSKGNVCHMGTKLEGRKVKYGWTKE